MCSDIELFINLIYMTETMKNLEDRDFDEYLNCVKQTQDWERFKDFSDIVNLSNDYINRAIEELKNNKEYSEILKNETKIDWDKIEKSLKDK